MTSARKFRSVANVVMAKISLSHVFFLALLCCTTKAWWPFESGKVVEPPTEVKDDKGEKTGQFLRNSPVPFEMSVAEQKFLVEAQRYMGDMAALDQCHQVVSLFTESNFVKNLWELTRIAASRVIIVNFLKFSFNF